MGLMSDSSDEKTEISGESRIKKQKNTKNSSKWWIIKIFIISFIISGVLSVVSEGAVSGLNVWIAILILLLFIFIGIVFDIIGVSVTTANPSVFNSMAAKKIRGAKTALWCTANSATVSNFCNDVIGDIAGIVSGSMGAVVSMSLSSILSLPLLFVSVIVTGFISAFTISGKALGKGIAIKRGDNIVFFISKLISVLKKEK